MVLNTRREMSNILIAGWYYRIIYLELVENKYFTETSLKSAATFIVE